MSVLEKLQAKYVKPSFTDVKVGDTVRVYTRIKEGEKERTQYFEGLVIRRKNGIGSSASFTVRRIASGVGVERTFPLFSPIIERIQVSRGAKTRRATLYTMRGLTGKAARLTEVPVKQSTDRDVEKHPWVAKYHVEKEAEANQEVELPEEAELEIPDDVEAGGDAGAGSPKEGGSVVDETTEAEKKDQAKPDTKAAEAENEAKADNEPDAKAKGDGGKDAKE